MELPGEPLRDPEYVRQAHVDQEARTMVWPNDRDPALALLHGHHEPDEPEHWPSERARNYVRQRSHSLAVRWLSEPQT